MMRWLVEHSMRAPVVVVALAVLVVVLGIRRAEHMPMDVFPEFAPPVVEIQTEAPGLTTPEVEALVTVPLESALFGLPWVKTVRSKTVLGLSSVVLILEDGADRLRSRQLVAERLTAVAPRLPHAAHPPVMLAPLSSTSRAMKIGVSSATLDQVELSTLARATIRPRLLAVPGVANVAIWGQRDRQLQVLVDPERLAARGVTLASIVRAAGDAASVSSGGFVETPNQRLALRHAASLVTAGDLANSIVGFEGHVPLRLGDVAEIVESHPAPIGDAVIDGGPGLLLIVEKQPWGNTLDVTRGVEAALAALAPGLSGVTIDATIFRPATFIEDAVGNLRHAMLLGCALVVLVLIAFLFDWRTALISVTAIPISLIGATLVLALLGESMNTMVLAGLVIALGEVVDDAIIDVENVDRRLRLERERATGRPRFATVLAASLEVRSAVVFGSLVVMMVLAPVFGLEGLSGAFFRPLALAYVIAILVSLVVALTLTPALCLWLLPGRARRMREPLLVRGLKRSYAALLPPLMRHPGVVALAIGASLALAVFSVTRMGEELLPSFRERDFLMHWVGPPGTSLEEMRRITQRASDDLRAIEGVRNFGAHIGRAEVADEVVGPNFTELWISLDPKVDYDATVAKVQAVVDAYPGLYRDLLTYLKERIKEVLTGASASIVARLYGPELDVLRDKARELAQSLEGTPGVIDLKVEAQVLVPQLELRIRSDDAARHGLTTAAVREQVTTLVRGTRVGELYDGQLAFDVTVWGAPEIRARPEALGALLLDAPGGARVRLRDVCEVAIVPAPNEIKRENASRRIDVTCNVSGRDLGSVARDVEARLGELEFARGYHGEILGEYLARESAERRMSWISGFALLGILLLLQLEFGSWRLAFLVLVSLPFALIGGVAGAWLGGGVLSLGSLIGFVTVLGIAARNAIMMVSHFIHLEREEGVPWGPELVLRGAAERLSPVLMTALAAGLALVPLVVSGSQPGQEVEYPLAIVVIGGLVTSTVGCLCFLPGLYLRFARPRAPVDSERARA